MAGVPQDGVPSFLLYAVGQVIALLCLIDCLVADGRAGWRPGLTRRADYEQGDGFRIIYVHVPSAWMALFIYAVMALNSAIFLVWRIKLADIIARSSAVIGASYTLLTLLTGSIWGKPMWGTWWVWDARLTYRTDPVISVPGLYRPGQRD